MLRLATILSQRVQSLLKRRGLGPEADPQMADPLSQKADGMPALLANSVRRKIAVGSHTGRVIARVGDQIDEDSMDAFESPRCAMVSGFSVHANVHIETRDRMRLTFDSLLRPARRRHGTSVRTARWPAPLPFETSMA